MMFLTQYILLPGPGDVKEGGPEVVESAQVDQVKPGETQTLVHLSRQVQEQLLQEGVQEEDQEASEVVESAQVEQVKAGETQTLFHLSRQVQEQLLREGVREEDQEVPEVEGREGFECEWESFGLF